MKLKLTKEQLAVKKNRSQSRDVLVRMTSFNINKDHTVAINFMHDAEKLELTEVLDLTDDHEKLRFSMFLESFEMKNLKALGAHSAILIREEIKFKLRIKRNNEILYSHRMDKDELEEYTKYKLLDNYVRDNRITKEQYEDLRNRTLKEVRRYKK